MGNIRLGLQLMRNAWRSRTEEGGMADDTALMGMLILGAITVSAAILAALAAAADNFDFGW